MIGGVDLAVMRGHGAYVLRFQSTIEDVVDALGRLAGEVVEGVGRAMVHRRGHPCVLQHLGHDGVRGFVGCAVEIPGHDDGQGFG